ncbi:MAG: hypothetical protein R3F34_16815 [Planctomycetota bacterium]
MEPHRDERSIDDLVAAGWDELAKGDHDAVLAIAAELESRRFSACFELAALGHAGKGELEQGVAVLERGVEAAPDVWVLWQLLGNQRSDLGDLDGAEAAYRRALGCPTVRRGWVTLNLAILEQRRGGHERSLEILDGVDDEALELLVAETRCRALLELGRADEAYETADAVRRAGLVDEDAFEEREGADDALPRLAAHLARARLARGDAPYLVREEVLESIADLDAHRELLHVLLELDGEADPDARSWRLLVLVRFDPDAPLGDVGPLAGCYVTYDVVAPSPEFAFERVVAFEASTGPPGGSCELESCTDLGPAEGRSLGVWWRGERHWFGEE